MSLPLKYLLSRLRTSSTASFSEVWPQVLIACFIASIVYNFGQYALGADAVTALFSIVNINVPKNISWILLVAVSVPLSLMYGSGDNPKGVRIVEMP